MVNKVFLFLTGACAGFLNGLLGTGGGIIIIFALSRINKNNDPKDNFATAIAAILPMSVVSAGFYLTRNSFDLKAVYPYILPAVVGGTLGAFLLCRIRADRLKRLFAVLLIIAGVNMIGK
ncbi:MAG: sulfite exporter TauE/SafE family protein [Ruminococcaceae bacterium]|nr:sulfite exporter TauE/SafE family protein [Oscillospiraceae bacterium]